MWRVVVVTSGMARIMKELIVFHFYFEIKILNLIRKLELSLFLILLICFFLNNANKYKVTSWDYEFTKSKLIV